MSKAVVPSVPVRLRPARQISGIHWSGGRHGKLAGQALVAFDSLNRLKSQMRNQTVWVEFEEPNGGEHTLQIIDGSPSDYFRKFIKNRADTTKT